MKRIISVFLIVACLLFVAPIVSNPVDAASRVRGYTKKNGTYVQPHYKSSPDKSKFNNYSTKGNYNPYTGKKGVVDPFKKNNK